MAFGGGLLIDIAILRPERSSTLSDSELNLD